MKNHKRAQAKDGLEIEHNDDAMDDDASIGDDKGLIESTGTVSTTISRMAISADGQWLATTDDLSRTYIFNLDSVQVSFSPTVHI